MILKRLTLSNIRAYKGKAAVDFATPGDRNVTVVHGVNGTGKTSLFEALNWALYGDNIKYNGHLLNESLLREAGEGGSVTGSVALEFEDNGESYFLSRGVVGTIKAGQVEEKQSGMELYKIDALGNSRIEKSAETKISQMLPSAIRTFFFFDGDKIAEFTRPGKEQDRQITVAVNAVLRLELLNRASKHLAQISSQFNREIADRGSEKVKKLQQSLERQEALRDQLVDRRELLQLELDAVSEKRAENDKKYREIEDVAEKSLRRVQLEGELKVLTTKIADAKAKLMRANVEAFMLPLNAILCEAEDILEQKRKKKQIPSDYKDTFLLDLLNQKKCICERDLLPATPPFLHVEGLLRQTVPSTTQEIAMSLHSDVKRILRNEDRCKANMLSNLALIESLTRELDSVQKTKEEIDLTFAREVNTSIRELESIRDQCDREISSYTFQLGGLGTQIQEARKNIEALDKEFRAESERHEGRTALTAQAEVASLSAIEISSIRERLVRELKDELSSEATRIFKSFTWKTEFFERVEIGEDYLIKLYDNEGRDMRAVMSMGETQLLSLAFILAMTEISDHQAPLVIDTPLARLDRAVRMNLVAALPKLTSQLVLLVTDSEMSQEVRGVIEERIGADYSLKFADGVASVMKGAA